ncbi:hypothetical protein, partial [Calidithermus roseus]|uniref:hypothetical protein n=1 Tax=Calidithermus roseus TaxID=1644118 RepID=UPI000E65A17D
MRSWRYLVLALLSGGVLAPLGLALTLRRARLWRVSAACLGGLALFALMWTQPYLWSSLLWLAGLAGLLVLAVGEERDPRAWGRAALLVLGQVLLGLGLALAAAGWLLGGAEGSGPAASAPARALA